jgi:hypothetical protein
MRVGERFIVTTDHGVRHPKGTLVEIKLICKGVEDDRPYYCQAVEGNTTYWYSGDELAKEVDGIRA